VCRCDVAKLGIVVDEQQMQWLERPLSYGDSRSQRVRDSIDAARAAEQALADNGFVDPHEQDLDAIVYEAVSAWAQSDAKVPDQ